MRDMMKHLGAAVLSAGLVVACDDSGPTGPSFMCSVTIEKHGDSNPHPRIFVQTIVQTASGSGSGSTQDAALAEARRVACAKLDLSSSERSHCERGTSPNLDDRGSVKLLSESSRQCSGRSSS